MQFVKANCFHFLGFALSIIAKNQAGFYFIHPASNIILSTLSWFEKSAV